MLVADIIQASARLDWFHVQSLFCHRRANRGPPMDARDAQHHRQMPPMPGVFPDYLAPIVRQAPTARELMLARWACRDRRNSAAHRSPTFATPKPALAHVAQTRKPVRGALQFHLRIRRHQAAPRKTPTWFALNDDRPLAFFAGIWTSWHGKRGTKANPVEGETSAVRVLMTDADAEGAPIHPKAMPVILTKREQIDAWLRSPGAEALNTQRPLPHGSLMTVARGGKEDGVAPEITTAEPRLL